MIFKTSLLPKTADNDLWKYCSLGSLILYCFTLFTNFTSWDNYLLMSIIIGVQLYFFIGRKQLIYKFSPNQLNTKLLWLNKKISFNAYAVIEKTYINKNRKNHEIYSNQILLLNDNKIVYTINKFENQNLFENIVNYLKFNVKEVDVENNSKQDYDSKDLLIIQLIIFFFSSLFFFGIYYENLSPRPNSLKKIEGTMRYKPDEYINTHKNKTTYQYRIHLINYKKQFTVYTEDYFKINRDSLLNAKNDIILFVDRNEFEYAHQLKKEPYFSSHFNTQESITIKKIKYNNQLLLDSELESSTNSNLIFIYISLASLGILGFRLYQFNKFYS